MNTVRIESRLTDRYVGTCSDLDSWRHVGMVRLTPARLTRQRGGPRGTDHSDDGAYLMHARIPRGQDPHESARALRDTLTVEGCHHEYDCCGCRSTRADVRRIGRRDFIVHVTVSRNY